MQLAVRFCTTNCTFITQFLYILIVLSKFATQ